MGNPARCATARFEQGLLALILSLVLGVGCAPMQALQKTESTEKKEKTQKDEAAFTARSPEENASPSASSQKSKHAQAKTSAWEQFKRIFPWNRNPPEAISDETVQLVRKFVQDENLEDLHIEWRNRDSAQEWKRIKENGRISPVVRYSAGSLHWTLANLRPSFLRPKTHYDPYSDTIYLQSNDAVPILAELAMAKTLRHAVLPGGQAVASNLPVLSIYARVTVAREVQAFARKMDDWELEKQSYRDLYPGLFSGSGVVTAAFVPFYAMPLIGLGGMAVGMVMGEAAIQMREAEIRQAKPEPVQVLREPRKFTVPSAPPAWEVAQKP